MIKHGASHGCATLTTTVAAGTLIFVLNKLMPHMLDFLAPAATKMAAVLQVWFVSEDVLAIIILASILAVFWGIAFRVKTS